MPKTTFAAAATGLPHESTECPVARMAREAAETLAVDTRLDQLSASATPSARDALEVASRHTIDRYSAIADLAAATRAESAAGALFQLCIAYDLIDDIVCNLDQDGSLAANPRRAIERCLYSAIHAIEAATGVAPERRILEHVIPDKFDPFQKFGDAR